jgi:hypothetical protein
MVFALYLCSLSLLFIFALYLCSLSLLFIFALYLCSLSLLFIFALCSLALCSCSLVPDLFLTLAFALGCHSVYNNVRVA